MYENVNGDYMLILSNGLTESADEGFLNVATNLVKRIKRVSPDTVVVSYDRKSQLADRYIELNKLLLNFELFSVLRKNKSSFLYIPFPAKMVSTALRIFILSLFSKSKVNALLVMRGNVDFAAKLLFKLSRAKIIVLSKESEDFYQTFLPEKNVMLLKTGVDCTKFSPVSEAKSAELKIKYGFKPGIPLILHVGHLNEGRNIRTLMDISEKYQVLLVTSTLTKNEQNLELKKDLLSRPNIRLIDEYISDINEIYQMSDVYFFPVVESGNCIDIPLSCLEAAACNKPVVTTDYRSMKDFIGKSGFYFLKTFDNKSINSVIEQALMFSGDSRKNVVEYNWDNATYNLTNLEVK